jgi:hypothetical protein
MDRDAEIDQIRHELEILRTRYGYFVRGGRMLQKSFWWVGLPTCVILALAVVVKIFLADPFSGVFAAIMLAVVTALLWTLRPTGAFPWVDLASNPPVPYSIDPSPYFFHRWNDVKTLKEQIAEREQRLSELGARQ